MQTLEGRFEKWALGNDRKPSPTAAWSWRVAVGAGFGSLDGPQQDPVIRVSYHPATTPAGAGGGGEREREFQHCSSCLEWEEHDGCYWLLQMCMYQTQPRNYWNCLQLECVHMCLTI